MSDWTNEQPKEEGIYWYCSGERDGIGLLFLMEIRKGDLGFFQATVLKESRKFERPHEYPNGPIWQGPIQPSTSSNVAAISATEGEPLIVTYRDEN